MSFPLFIALLTTPLIADASNQDSTSADADAKAKRYYKNGTTLYAEGQYADSIIAFQEAYRLSGRHALLYNIASAQERLGELEGAIDSLSRYRIHADPDEQAILGRRIDNLNTRLAEQKKESQTVTSPKPSGSDGIETENGTETAPLSTAPETRLSKMSLTPWIGGTLALSTIGLIGGSYYSINAKSRHDELTEICRNGLCPSSAAEFATEEANSRKMASISWSVGLIGGGTAAALWAWHFNRSKKDKQ